MKTKLKLISTMFHVVVVAIAKAYLLLDLRSLCARTLSISPSLFSAWISFVCALFPFRVFFCTHEQQPVCDKCTYVYCNVHTYSQYKFTCMYIHTYVNIVISSDFSQRFSWKYKRYIITR